MATALKYMYNPSFFDRLCPILKDRIPGFDCRDFIFRIFNNEWPDLELKERVRHISTVLHHFLSKDFSEATQQLIAISQTLKSRHFREQGFENIFLADYIEVFGLEHPEESFLALEEITKLVSAEFALRPFIVRYPGRAMEYLYKWSRHKDANVRRLSSEGSRPRLPWAIGLPDFKKDPAPALPILENLREDPSEYVRRSVANHLNDIAKDHPDIVIELVKKWQGKHPGTDWIIRLGCRSLLKSGHTQALTLHGFDPDSQARIRELLLPTKVKIGQYLDFKFAFISKEKKPTNFRLEYAIDYLTSTGKTSRKVFKISENLFLPGKPVTIRRKQSFKNFTTRKHFRGKHFLSILANGKKLATTEFIVC
ncbi:MAG: DNA alkylation repair protein [Cyclobacteriaceae bacterium]